MEISIYSKNDEAHLFDMMREEGSDWECYWGESEIERYKTALMSSITYVAYENNKLCGYARCRDDDGFGVYVYDLLVRKTYRGNSIGRMLMEKVCTDFPNNTVYVMSDVDEYYKKLGYRREGSIFEVTLVE